jgi:hypothetical protein
MFAKKLKNQERIYLIRAYYAYIRFLGFQRFPRENFFLSIPLFCATIIVIINSVRLNARNGRLDSEDARARRDSR